MVRYGRKLHYKSNRGQDSSYSWNGNKKNRFTVVLTCAAGKFCLLRINLSKLAKITLFFIVDGTKLPPICIFKGKRMPRGEHAPSGIIVWFQDNGWMDANLMKEYVEYLNDELANEDKVPRIMVYDSFKGHLEESVKEKFREYGFNLAVIPGGLTSICQPLDVAINKPFKDNLCKEWHLWMASGGAGETAAGNL